MNSTEHGSVLYPHVQINISYITQHFFDGSHTFSFLCTVLPLLLFSPLPSCLTLGVVSVMSLCVLLSHTQKHFLFLCAVPHRKLLKWGFSWCCSSHARAGGWLSFLCWRKHRAGQGQPDVSYIAWKLLDGVFPVLRLGGQGLKEKDLIIKSQDCD